MLTHCVIDAVEIYERVRFARWPIGSRFAMDKAFVFTRTVMYIGMCGILLHITRAKLADLCTKMIFPLN